ncbi:MAG: hypothetical protein ACXWVJ_08805, partial [Caulobacteraceae bacterium]
WPVGPASAQAPVALSDDDLSDLRGGFITANGITFSFGAVARTFVGGELALESRLTWNAAGALSERRVGNVPGAVDLATALDAAKAGGLDLGGLGAADGLLLSDANGSTALIQTLQGGIRNLIINNADGRDLRQEVEVTLTIPDLGAMQHSYAIERLGSQIGQDISTGLLASLRR